MRPQSKVFFVAAAVGAALLIGRGAHAETAVFAPGSRISVADFGASPNDGKNDAAALRSALESAKAHRGAVLYFAPGIYNFRDARAVQLMDDAMAGKFGPNPESTIFKAYYPYVRGLDFRGASGLTLDARGAVLLFEGWMEPVSLDRSHDVTIVGLTIDYKRRAYSGGKVVALGAGYFDAVIEDRSPINPQMPVPRVMFWDAKAHRMIGDGDPKKIEITGAQRVRIYFNEAMLPFIKDARIGLMHSMHFRPAILIQDAGNIRLEGVTIHSQPGMGIVGHRSSNITLSGLRVVPAPGAYFSTNTDATHFTSCSGIIRIESSQFEAHGDDGTNVHNYYYSVAKVKGLRRYLLTLPINTHAAVVDYPDVGDALDVVRTGSLELVKSVLVKSVAIDPHKLRVEVDLEGDLPGNLDQYYLVNTTRLPKVEIIGSRFMSSRSRGVLIKTRNVLIERNFFLETTGTAIHVAAEGGWREGVPSENVTIRENRIIGGGYGGGTIGGASAIAVNIDSTEPSSIPLHRRLLIEGNVIDGAGAERCIWISRVDGVEIRYNEVSGCRAPIGMEFSEHVNVHDNTIAEDAGS